MMMRGGSGFNFRINLTRGARPVPRPLSPNAVRDSDGLWRAGAAGCENGTQRSGARGGTVRCGARAKLSDGTARWRARVPHLEPGPGPGPAQSLKLPLHRQAAPRLSLGARWVWAWAWHLDRRPPASGSITGKSLRTYY